MIVFEMLKPMSIVLALAIGVRPVSLGRFWPQG
jgi:hypothetical protein